MANDTMRPAPAEDAVVGRHLRFGWWGLLGFLTVGIALEAMHGFKVGWYLDATNETRRLLLTLGHAHGVLLALVNVAFGVTVRTLGGADAAWARRASPCLLAATVLLPGGFLLGGLIVYGGDPGLGVVLVPVGAVLLLTGVLLTARGVGSAVSGTRGGSD
jgi:hypothetical protein